MEKRGATVHDGRQRNPNKKLSNREIRSCDVSPKGAANSEPTGVTGYAQIDAVDSLKTGYGTGVVLFAEASAKTRVRL